MRTDEQLDKQAESVRRYRKRIKQKEIRKKIAVRLSILRVTGALQKRIEFHLSKGRDAADITIRENIPYKVIQEYIQNKAHGHC